MKKNLLVFFCGVFSGLYFVVGLAQGEQMQVYVQNKSCNHDVAVVIKPVHNSPEEKQCKIKNNREVFFISPGETTQVTLPKYYQRCLSDSKSNFLNVTYKYECNLRETEQTGSCHYRVYVRGHPMKDRFISPRREGKTFAVVQGKRGMSCEIEGYKRDW